MQFQENLKVKKSRGKIPKFSHVGSLSHVLLIKYISSVNVNDQLDSPF